MTIRKLARTGGISILAAVLFMCCAIAQVPPLASTAPWEPVARLPGGSVDTVVFDTAHPGVAFAGSESGYLYRSTDGGASWKSVKVGTSGEGFRAIAVSPATPGTVYAYSTDNFFSGLGTLYRSVDDGRTWQPTASQPSSSFGGAFFPGQGRGIVIDPTGQILVLTDSYAGVLRSADGGVTWTNPVPNTRAFGLSKDPNQHGVLWAAGLDRATQLATVWKSTDFGATWTAQTPDAFNPPAPFGVFAYAIAVQPGTGVIFANWSGTDPNTFAPDGGMVVSTNGGQTWSAQDDGLLPSYSPGFASADIAFDPVHADTIYLSNWVNGDLAGGGFYRSRDRGHTWEPIGTALRTLGTSSVSVRPEMRGYPAAVFAGTPDLFVSNDHGKHWDRSDFGLDGGGVGLIADDGIASGGYYAASGDGLFHSTDDAASWVRINTWNGPDGAASFAIDRNSEDRTIYVPSFNRLWRSTNAGRSWTDVTPAAPAVSGFTSVLVDPHHADYVYAAAFEGILFFSRNAGRDWSSVLCGYGAPAGDSLSTNALLRAHGMRGDLYVPLVSGLWVATADGTNCAPAAAQPIPGGYITSMAEMGTDPSALLVSGFPASGLPVVMRSADGGATYQPVDSLPGIQNLGPWNLTSSPHGHLGAASLAGDTVAISRDGGANWTTQPDVFYDLTTGFSVLFATRGKVFWANNGGDLYVAPDETLR